MTEIPTPPTPPTLTVAQAYENVAGALNYATSNLVQLALQREPLNASLALLRRALQAPTLAPTTPKSIKKAPARRS